MHNQSHNTYEQALVFEQEGNVEKAIDCLQQLIEQGAEGQGEAFFLLAGIYFRAGKYAEALDNFIKCHKKGHRCQEVLDIVVEAYYQPNQAIFTELYEKNVKHLSKYEQCNIESFPEVDSLSYMFIPYSETKYIIYDKREKQFLVEIVFNGDRNLQEFHENAVLILKNEFDVDKIAFYARDRLDEKYRNYVTTVKPFFLIFEKQRMFFEFLQVSPFFRLLEKNKCVFLFGLEELEAWFSIEGTILPSCYLNMNGKEDPYYKFLTRLHQTRLHRPTVGYQNLMVFLSQSFNAGK